MDCHHVYSQFSIQYFFGHDDRWFDRNGYRYSFRFFSGDVGNYPFRSDVDCPCRSSSPAGPVLGSLRDGWRLCRKQSPACCSRPLLALFRLIGLSTARPRKWVGQSFCYCVFLTTMPLGYSRIAQGNSATVLRARFWREMTSFQVCQGRSTFFCCVASTMFGHFSTCALYSL